jgi:Tol biopolymer transport system component
LSRDGKTLYFSSDMPGSLGGVDIWKVSISADGTAQTENLGKKINTEGNESFPFIADDNSTLFFASAGRQGFGGLDIYMIDLAKGTDAVNLGKPVNTEKMTFRSLSMRLRKQVSSLVIGMVMTISSEPIQSAASMC